MVSSWNMGQYCFVFQKHPSEGRVNPGTGGCLCSGRLTDGLGRAKYTTFSFSFKPYELPWSKVLGVGGGGRMKLFPIDCLIAPEAACPRLWPRASLHPPPPCVQ